MIWGAGKNCKIVLKAIRRDMCNFIGIVDSNEKLYRSLYMNRWLVVSPEILRNSQIDYIVISVSNNEEILEQCVKMGIEKEKIIDYWNTNEEYCFIDDK